MSKQIDWMIHYCANGVCDECGKAEEGFIPYACNAHTHSKPMSHTIVNANFGISSGVICSTIHE